MNRIILAVVALLACTPAFAQRIITHGATSEPVYIRIIDSATGVPETGVTSATTGIDLEYTRSGAAPVDITESDLAATNSAYSSGGIKHIGGGVYRVDVPDAAYLTGVESVVVGGTITDMIVIPVTVQLTAFDLQSTTALATQASVDEVIATIGEPIDTDLATDIANVTVTENDIQTAVFGVTGRTLDITATGAAHINWAGIENPTTAVALSGTTVDLIAGAVDATAVANDAIDATAIASSAITAAKIDTAAIGADEIGADAIGASEIATSAIGELELAPDAITSSEIAADAIGASEIGSNAITATEIDLSTEPVASVIGNVGGSVASVAGEVGGIVGTISTFDELGTTGNPNVILASEIASVTNQTTIVLTDGATFDNAYNGQAIALYDDSNSDYPSVRLVNDYVGATKTVTLDSAADFTVGADDSVRIFATAPGTAAPTASTVASAVRTELTTELGRIDATVSSRASASAISTVQTTTDAILVDTGTTLDDLVDDLESRLTSARATTIDKLDAAFASSGVFSSGALANTPSATVELDPEDITEIADTVADAVGTSFQPRINRKPDPAFTVKVSRRADGTHKAPTPIRITPGAIDAVYVFIDMSPLFGNDNYVATVGTPTVEAGGSITASAEGPRDTYAVVELDGTATASEERTITVPVTMDTGTTVNVAFDVIVFAE